MKSVRFPKIFMLLMIFVLMFTACAPQATQPEVEGNTPQAPAADPTATTAQGQTDPGETTEGDCHFQDSPALAGMNLPDVCERLPVSPLVFEHSLIIPMEFINDPQIGSYGGPVVFTIGEGAIFAEPLFYSVNRTPIPTASNIFASMEPNDDFTVFTFTIRRGLKWSDGVPVTTEDVRFALEDVTGNTEIYPVYPNWLRTGGSGSANPGQLGIVDDFTFTLTFDGSFPAFGKYLAGNWLWYSTILKPKHYLSQFHGDYADAAALNQLVQDAGLDEWQELVDVKDATVPSEEDSIGQPRLDPWLMSEYAEDRYILKRNPYYGMVDSAGNQLPYIDELIVYPVAFSAPETAELMLYSGQGHYNWNLDLTKLPLYKQEEANGKIVAYPYPNKDSRMMTLNLTYDDPVWREIVGDVRFRRAVALAMDKEEINSELYMNTASIPTVTPGEYDPAEANRLLDEMGMDQRDGEGFRLTPGGERFEIILTLMPEIGYSMQAPFIADYMREVGIRLTYRQVEGGVYWNIITANEHMGTIVWNFAPKFESNTAYPGFLPYAEWAPLWREWYESGGSIGEEPPDWIKEAFSIYEEMSRHEYGSPEYQALEQRRNEWVYNNVPYMSFVEQPGIVHIFSTCLGNVAGGPGTTGMPYHHGSWTHHRLIYWIPGCTSQ
jgi:peptide/nickel transport system substrate-binding protein